MSGKIPNASQGENRARRRHEGRALGRWVVVVALILVVGVAGLYLAGVPGVGDGLHEPEPAEVTDPDAGPVPVVLVPGWRDTPEDLAPLRARFLEADWPKERVRAVGFEDPVGGNVEHAHEIAEAVGELRTAHGGTEVDVVAHSMGGLAVRHYLHFLDGDEDVRRVAFLGTPHRGTALAFLAWGEGAQDMLPGSDFLEELNQGRAVPEGVEALALRTALDLRVLPASSAVLPGVHNVEVCCPTHPGMIDDDATFDALKQFLRAGPDLPDPYLPESLLPQWDEWMDGIGVGGTG